MNGSSPPAGPHLVAVGAVCATRIFQVGSVPPLPAKVLASNLVSVVDGMAISAACAFVRLGGRAAVWARCGNDAAGADARAALQAEGLDVTGLRAIEGAATSQASVVVDARGERLVVPFHDPSVDASPHWLPLHMLGKGAGPQMLLCDVRWLEGAEAALRAAHAANVPSMLDGDTAAPGVLERLVPLATHLVFSDAGLLSFTGAADVHAGLRDLARRRVATAGPHQPALLHLGASCGADGYRWLQPTAGPSPGCWADATLQHVPAPVVAAVDTLAAGDVFHGALALALLEGRDTADAARWACAAASLKCTRFGGRLGCPSRAELDAHVLATREEGSYPG